MKRIISFIMVLAMLVGVMPISAGAEEALDAAAVQETTAESVPEKVTEASTEPPATSEAVEETQPQVAVETQPPAPAETEPSEPKILSWEEYRYTLLADGTVSICGFTGTPEDADKPFLVEVPDAIQGAAVTEIAEMAFAENDKINAVLLPETIQAIGSGAFEDCENLKVVAFCGDAPSFGETLVKDCDNLTEIDVLENRDFSALKELLEVDLDQETAQSVQFQSFENDAALEEYTTSLYNDGAGNTLPQQSRTSVSAMAAATTVASGTCGDNLTWVLDSEGTLTITGSGDMYAYNKEGICAPWYNIREKVTQATIGGGITSIGQFAFHDCSNLISVAIPHGVVSIGNGAFWGCSSLTGVTIPNSISYIGASAFCDCSSLTSIIIPSSVSSIRDDTFDCCTSLTSVSIPSSVTSIGNFAFCQCSSLTRISIPNGVISIGSFAFRDCSQLSDVYYSGTAQEWGQITISTGNDPLTSATIHYNSSDSEATIVDSGYCGANGNNLTWALDSKGILTISGTGKMMDFHYNYNNASRPSDVPWYSVREKIIQATIGSNVTSIGNHAFEHCSALTSVTIPNSVSTIGDYAFNGCSKLTSLAIPEAVTSIGFSAFMFCSSLTSVIIPNSVTSIGASAFWNCSSLTSVTIPSSITSIGSGTFFGCSSLTCVTIPDRVNSIGEEAFSNCKNLVNITIPETVTSIEIGAFLLCEKLTDVYYCGTEDQWSQISIDVDNEPLLNAIIHYNYMITTVTRYPSNGTISINKAGSAYAYYKSTPNSSIIYHVNAQEYTANSDENGIFRIPLGDYSNPGEYTVAVTFTKVGEKELSPAKEIMETVKVTPLSFKQEWKASMSADVSAKLDAGVGIKIPAIDVEATLGKVEVKAEGGNALNFSREFSESGETLELTSDQGVTGSGSAKSGITGHVQNTRFTLVEGSAAVESNQTCTYGIKIANYSADNSAQQRAVATFLLGEALRANPNNLMFVPFYKALSTNVYTQSGCDVIDGSTSGVSSSVGADFGKVKINDVDLFTTATANMKAAISMSARSTTAGEESKTASYKTNKNIGVVSGKLPIDDNIELKSSVLSRDYLGKDVTVTAKAGADGKSVETSSLSASVSDPQLLLSGQHTISSYNKYKFTDNALNELLNNTSYFDSYLNGSRTVLTANDLNELGTVLSTSAVPIQYSRQTKDQTLVFIPFEIGASLGIGAELGVKLSYLEGTSYADAKGYAMNDQILLTGVSSDLSTQVSQNKRGLTEIFTNSLKSLVNDAANFFKKVVGSVKDGVQSAWSWISEKANSTKNWIVTITSASNDGVWADSYSIDTCALHSYDTVLPKGVSSEYSANYEVTKAATIGRPFLISVADEYGNAITDLRDEPLEYTIRYADADLQAAGLSRYSSVVRNGGIAMYRYSDDGDYYEYVGGVNDLDAMTVTATIVKTGQYILAADSCAPELSNLDVSDYHATPTITAKVTDLTGLDLNSFRFMLDGHYVVDGTNAAEHFNKATGVFAYTVPENMPLSEGEHTMAFTLSDTTGNSETYSFTFPVDLTSPVITQYSVEGHTNAGSTVEIRAQVSDTNLTEVNALFSKRLPDGTWTEKAPAQMADLGNGLWGLDYEGSGSSVRICVQATDIAGNTIESDPITVTPLVEAVTLSQDYILLRQNQTVTLQAEATPRELTGAIQWSVENPAETQVLTVNELGEVAAKNVGTGYVLATVQNGEDTVTARCRVDVAEPISLESVQLGASTLTTELFKTDYASFDVVLLLKQNESRIMSADAISPDSAAPEDNGVAISSARFEDEQMDALFALAVKDDRTLLVVPRQTAVDNPNTVGKSYSGKVIVNVGGEEFTTDSSLKLTVKKTMPKLKAASLSFNSFYTNQAQPIVITGATVTGISRNTVKDTAKTVALPTWLILSDGVLTLTDDAPAKSASGSAYVLVETEEWAMPIAVTVPVKLAYKAPGLKLSASSVTFANAGSSGVSLKLLCSGKADTLASLNVSGIRAPEGFDVSNFNRVDGSFTLVPNGAIVPGTMSLVVSFGDTDKTVALKLKVSAKAVTLSAKPGNVTLNSVVGDSAVIQLTASPVDYQIIAPTFRLIDSSGAATDQLDFVYSGGTVTIKTNASTRPGATYKLYVAAPGSKEAVITVKTLAEKNSKPTLSAKVTGAIDLSFPESYAAVVPSFRNYSSGLCKLESWTVTESKGKTNLGDATGSFELDYRSGQYRLRAKGDLTTGNTYLLAMTFSLDDGSTYSCSAKIPVKRTAVKLKLSKTSLSLNKTIGDYTEVGVTCLTKNYDFKQPMISKVDNLDVVYSNGKLNVAVNENTQYGKTYKVTVRATQADTPVTLTVKIPAQNKSTVTASLKTKGSIDVIRDGTSVTVTPAYKNYAGLADIEPALTIESFSSKKGEPYQPVSEGQFVVTPNANGSYTIAKVPGALVNPALKYRAKLTFKGGAQPAYVNLTVKTGTVKATLDGTPVLYQIDRNSRGTFKIRVMGETVNPITKVEIRDAKVAALYQIYNYGNGEFAIGFKDNTVQNAKYPTSAALAVFFDGSQKPSASITLKLQIR